MFLYSFVLVNNGLHVEIRLDRESFIGRSNISGIKDVIMEAALTAIRDLEDSVAAVDAEDKARVYSNWAGLMKGDLETKLVKDGEVMVRTLNADKEGYCTPGMHIYSTLACKSVSLLMYLYVTMFFHCVL